MISFLAADPYPARTEGALSLAQWLAGWTGWPYEYMLLAGCLIVAGVIIGFMMFLAGASTLVERKVSAWIQRRMGPNQVGLPNVTLPLIGITRYFERDGAVLATS